MDISKMTIKKAREMLDNKECTAVELASAYLKNIESQNKNLNAYLEVFDDVLEQAKEADQRIANGEKNPLLGIPLAIKDNILIKGRKVSSASKILENYVATYDATVISKLKSQGAVLLGRTNMDEFACGGSTENSAFGITKNPHDDTRVPGGSSGGSASAVAGLMALCALGSDTGGSVREPAAFCGIVGFKPTYGSISRSGLMAMGSSLDVIGPMTVSVSDAEILFDSMRGKDKLDGTSIDVTYDDINKPLTIGVPRHIINNDGIDNSVRLNLEESIDKLKSLGYKIKDITLPNIDKSLAVYYILMPAEVSSNMARFDGIKYGMSIDSPNLLDVYKKTRGQGFGKEVRRRIILGTYVLSSGYYDAYYGKVMKARKIITKEFSEAFKDVDAILTPTTPSPAFKIGEKSDPLQMYLADIFTVTANIVGCPAISIPSGFVDVGGKKLPLGIQLMSKHSSENILFQIGKDFLGE